MAGKLLGKALSLPIRVVNIPCKVEESLIARHLKVPTGDIFVVRGEKGLLEVVSLGDYGKGVNLNQNEPVPDGLPLMPLSEKWVITLSTQYGCAMNCTFCDVPKVGNGLNASFDDLWSQLSCGMSIKGAPEKTKRLNIHFARMGEPTWNPNVLVFAHDLAMVMRNMNPHPVVSTMMPKRNRRLSSFLREWMLIKNFTYSGNAGLQLSINSTDSEERRLMFAGNAMEIADIAELMRDVRKPIGRKITLNFAVADYTIDCGLLGKLFSPEQFIVKLTPMHRTRTAEAGGIKTSGTATDPEPYRVLKDRFEAAGFEVLVFVASKEEDESRITCGNAILSGAMPERYTDETDKALGGD